ncbi:putative HAD superfamily hydrolase [Xylariaceae sp. FL0804]|nr:putative HAD superfamily hydrolase [Xylariaceae sp. FL0804]
MQKTAENPGGTLWGRKGMPQFAFAFDIDGVLLHQAKPIPGATETLLDLQKRGIPFILLTNGGGKHESERVAELSANLGVPLTTDNFVQSHTPFQELLEDHKKKTSFHGRPQKVRGLRNQTVLVTGSDPAKAREIAYAYGFESVVIPADVLAAYPTIYPFDPVMAWTYAHTARPLPVDAAGKPRPIAAVLVFNDPRDWALDIQLIIDVMLSKDGVLGTRQTPLQLKQQPGLYFSNPDVIWSAAYPFPRLGQGAFKAAVKGVWRSLLRPTPSDSDPDLHHIQFGKPHTVTYRYAERVLEAYRTKMFKKEQAVGDESAPPPLRRIWMVGDNPASDIRGARRASKRNVSEGTGLNWLSALVKTGVYSDEIEEPRPGDTFRRAPHTEADFVAADVREAVEYALHREGRL